MNSHVSAILLGVKDMERSKRFYVDGLGWKVESDYKISVFFVPHGGSIVGFYGRDGLADMVGASPDGSGFSGVVFNYIVRSEARVDEVMAEAKQAGADDPQARCESAVGRVRRIPSLTLTATSGTSATARWERISPTPSSRERLGTDR